MSELDDVEKGLKNHTIRGKRGRKTKTIVASIIFISFIIFLIWIYNNDVDNERLNFEKNYNRWYESSVDEFTSLSYYNNTDFNFEREFNNFSKFSKGEYGYNGKIDIIRRDEMKYLGSFFFNH
jgi:hypothetical protein